MMLGRLICLVLLLLSATFAVVHGQPGGKVARLAVLMFDTPATNINLAAFLAGLHDLGYVERRNVVLDYRYAEGRPERVAQAAAETVALKSDVIVVLGGDMVPAVKALTSTAPIVILTSFDPVEAGVINSFARPGGNLTGVAFVSTETAGKRLQFLKEAAPSITRVAVLWNSDHQDGEYRNTEAAARQLGVHIQSLDVRRIADFDGAFEAAMRARTEALLVISSRFLNVNRPRIVEFASMQRLPLVTGWGAWARAGGLMSYGPDLDVLARRVATYVDRILKGAKPGDLPVEQPTRFELAINLKTAKSLGLPLAPSILARADHIIEE